MKALVTGGGGFLGRRIVELLVQQGHEVRFLARSAYPEVEALGAKGVQADLRDMAAVKQAVEGVDTIFHVAAKAGVWGTREEFHSINVDGTRNLLDAAESAGVARFIYTSTPSVVSYSGDIENGAQDLPYATTYPAFYPETKAEAERMVLTANSRHLATVSLRPHMIFGPGDNNLMPRFVTGALKGKMRRIGDGTNMVDFTFVDNAAWAHLDAANALESHTAACAGKAYFISNDEPVNLWGWFNGLLGELDVPPVSKKMSHKTARSLFGAVEMVSGWIGKEPLVTRFLADAMATSHWFDQSPAKQDLGYYVRVSMADALPPTVTYLKGHTVEPFLANV